MARRNANPNQIIRKDGKNCFVEVLRNPFEIGRVLFKFVTYDLTRQSGDKFTNEIDIYLSFEQFYRIAYDILDSRNLINGILKDKQQAAAESAAKGSKVYPKQRIITQGGTSAERLAASGKARPDGKSLARVLKMFAGDKLPIMFIAEQGPGETDSNGLIIPKYGYNPEQKVMIGLSSDDAKELFLITRAEIDAYLTAKRMMEMMNPPENKYQSNQTAPTNQYQQNYNQAPTQTASSVQQSAPVQQPKEEPFMNPPEDFPINDDLFGGDESDFFG